MISLKAATISPDQREQLTKHKEALKNEIEKNNSASSKVVELRTQETELEQKANSLKHGVASLRLERENQLDRATNQIHQVHEAIIEAEGHAHDDKLSLFRAMDDAQEVVQKISQATYAELIEKVADALAPFFDNRGNADWTARDFPAVRALTAELLQHGCTTSDSIERIHTQAKDVLRKLDALLTGDVIWSYQALDGKAEPHL